ncbi:HflK protein [Thioploca ingrica]|uniref:Protein HflK n=1 Tax=Thioploca ingrica TaxID=40754 RepID=A0A090AHE5_9GAMM|nr:HflK protein [Thioploca ingrica]
MAWNEPGGNGSKDPWGHRKNEQGPPDLDEVIKKMRDKLGGWFGGNPNRPIGGSGDNLSGLTVTILMGALLGIWLLFGFYIVQPAERGVVTRFGRYQQTTDQGLHWHLPYPIEDVQKIDVQQVRAINHKALMLTEDENIVEIELVVQYQVGENETDAKNYLFNVLEPDNTLHQATESALREIVGSSNMDAVLTNERDRVTADATKLIQTIVNNYQTGLKVISVNMQNAQPPEAVQSAFADVIKAREDEERSKNKAQTYKNGVVEQAGGTAGKLIEEAKAYKSMVVAHAQGETQRFAKILTEYEKAPTITRQRLYLEAMEAVLDNTSKVLVDIPGNNNLMVLPLDKILTSSQLTEAAKLTPTLPSTTNMPSQSENNKENDPRSRGER